MEIDRYDTQCPTNNPDESVNLFVRKDAKPQDVVPEGIYCKLKAALFVESITLNEGDKMDALSPDRVIKGIESKNFYLAGIKIGTAVKPADG